MKRPKFVKMTIDIALKSQKDDATLIILKFQITNNETQIEVALIHAFLLVGNMRRSEPLCGRIQSV